MGKWLPVLLFLSLLAIAFAQARPGQIAEDVKSDLETKHEGPVQKPIGRGRKRRRLFGEEAEPGTGLKEKKRRRRNKKNGKVSFGRLPLELLPNVMI
ncbi:unnamed protein product [Calicophoron daubneyi]|uniref:Uncharacterized protein n=1 Tax=Calicophoron daubneyi TaxID=300641 RepID=A0AAV2TCG7_CALDB